MSQNVPKEQKMELALLLASGSTISAAAEQLQICRKTIHRKLAKPAFRGLVAKLRNQLIMTALGRMADNMTQATETLVELTRDKDSMVRLRAARAVVGLGLKLRDSVELNERMDDVERELALKQGEIA